MDCVRSRVCGWTIMFYLAFVMGSYPLADWWGIQGKWSGEESNRVRSSACGWTALPVSKPHRSLSSTPVAHFRITDLKTVSLHHTQVRSVRHKYCSYFCQGMEESSNVPGNRSWSENMRLGMVAPKKCVKEIICGVFADSCMWWCF